MSGRVVGKKALITGAAQGLGAASAWGLAREGARVLLTDVNEAGARQVAEAIDAELGAGVAHSMRHDVSNEDDWIAAIARARETMGGLSVLLNNAGIDWRGYMESMPPGSTECGRPLRRPFERRTGSSWLTKTC